MNEDRLWGFLVNRSFGFLALLLSVGILLLVDQLFFDGTGYYLNHTPPKATASAYKPSVSKLQLAQLDDLRDAIINKTHTSGLSSWEVSTENGTTSIEVRIPEGDTIHVVRVFTDPKQSLHYSLIGQNSTKLLNIVDDKIDGIVDAAKYPTAPSLQEFDRYQKIGLEYQAEYQEAYQNKIDRVTQILGL